MMYHDSSQPHGLNGLSGLNVTSHLGGREVDIVMHLMVNVLYVKVVIERSKLAVKILVRLSSH